MKQKFRKSWKSSRQPRKQKKYAANAPLHIKRRFTSANLSKELRKKHNRRNIPLRKGDEVMIMRGEFKKKKGKITKVMLKISKVIVDGIQKKKKDGSKIDIKMEPSNLQIIGLNLDDKRRLEQKSNKKIEDKKENKEEKTEKTK
ncbi:MAG: 50S ribosomal protein L24 [Candidatus Nanoarchaeia archaeon]|nr:50S ribosomal protein L24 [Candidatus Nanoarchaeia archaeon]